MPAEGFRQEMPPKGGFSGITFERIPLKRPWSGVKIVALYSAVTAVSFVAYGAGIRRRKWLKRENEEVTVCLEPLLRAERDRIFLKQLWDNRNEERELMKNVPGWQVGTIFGEPVYQTVGNAMLDANNQEYYAHNTEWDRFNDLRYDFWF